MVRFDFVTAIQGAISQCGGRTTAANSRSHSIRFYRCTSAEIQVRLTAAPSGLVRQVVAQASPGKSPPPRRSCSAGGERMSPRPRPPCRSVPTRPQSCKSRFYDIGTARSPATTSPNGTHRRAAVDPPAQTALRASPRHPCVHCIDICARSIGSMLHASVTDARGSPRHRYNHIIKGKSRPGRRRGAPAVEHRPSGHHADRRSRRCGGTDALRSA